MSVGVDPSGCQDHRTDHATAFADLHGQGVGRYEDEGAGVAQGRLRKEATCSSSSAAMRETCDFESELMPKVPISLSMRRVETPAR